MLEVDPAADRVEVAVTNQGTDAEYHALVDRIGGMNREPDALRHYMAAMKESPSHVRGGLGLARIRFECQLDLSVSRSGGRITVHASGALRTPPITVRRGSHA
jgi:hypothetical protein